MKMKHNTNCKRCKRKICDVKKIVTPTAPWFTGVGVSVNKKLRTVDPFTDLSSLSTAMLYFGYRGMYYRQRKTWWIVRAGKRSCRPVKEMQTANKRREMVFYQVSAATRRAFIRNNEKCVLHGKITCKRYGLSVIHLKWKVIGLSLVAACMREEGMPHGLQK